MRTHHAVEVLCPVCKGDKYKSLFNTRDYVFSCTDQVFRVNRCLTCGCGYLSPRPAKEDIPAYYPKEFYWSWEGDGDTLGWESIVNKRGTQLVEKAKWLADIKPGRLLDIGAQKGEFLWYMQGRGWVVEGVELDSSVPNPAKMPICYGDFLEMKFQEGVYDVITYWAVLEHVYEPRLFIEKASLLLKPGGLIIGVVTNLNSIQSRFYQADDYPRHLTIFTKNSVKKLCGDYDLEIARIHTGQEIFGGSLNGGLVYMCKRLFGYSTTEAMSEWKQIKNPDLFWCQWRGKESFMVKNVSRLDRLLSYPVEKVLDKLGFGLTLSFSAKKGN
ncbi:bifunctional 2-polyprenyl-6-hydroxyphenol methylase/3-demethylubiquinol 3-O-methyltransferase UbiG [Pseudomonas sp. CC6-YY-74]|uniref:class I SAM-dependent methyltransferase n=1 Tax=Pseudomonas sp. CC6-YY-74 TaxID=1930532 RepID=UPI0009A23C1D|nr:class I SAM-dependent methyltransferase [Pseudomonas sp. CC6-YY-74]